jgi:DNA-binding transcriptional regulator YiaG
MRMDYKKKHKEWKESNPIRIYRKENKLSLSVVASLLGVGVYTVQRWEDGAVSPNDDNMEKVVRLIGGDAARQWEEWLDSRPGL